MGIHVRDSKAEERKRKVEGVRLGEGRNGRASWLCNHRTTDGEIQMQVIGVCIVSQWRQASVLRFSFSNVNPTSYSFVSFDSIPGRVFCESNVYKRKKTSHYWGLHCSMIGLLYFRYHFVMLLFFSFFPFEFSLAIFSLRSGLLF